MQVEEVEKGEEGRRGSLFRIVHAPGAILNEVGPARCSATPALTSQPMGPAARPSGACRRPVLAVCPILDLVSGWPDGLHSRGVPIGLGVWVVRRVTLAGYLRTHAGQMARNGHGRQAVSQAVQGAHRRKTHSLADPA